MRKRLNLAAWCLSLAAISCSSQAAVPDASGSTADAGVADQTSEIRQDALDTCTGAGCAFEDAALRQEVPKSGCDTTDDCPTTPCCKVPICTLERTCGCATAICDDANPCTSDSCTGASCLHSPLDAIACDDGEPCTANDVCVGGKCLPGAAKSCDDANTCTTDLCNLAKCSHMPLVAACSDGNACTSGDACADGTCKPGTVMVCIDDNECTADLCDNTNGCMFGAKIGSCSDDGNVCTGDACIGTNCTHLALAATPCSDGDACTTGDKCSAGVCLSMTATTCDDGNTCTTDTCSSGLCAHLPESGAACDDGSPCTSADVCEQGQCAGKPAVWTQESAKTWPADIRMVAENPAGGWAFTASEGGKSTLTRVASTGEVVGVTATESLWVSLTARTGGWATAGPDGTFQILNEVGLVVATYVVPGDVVGSGMTGLASAQADVLALAEVAAPQGAASCLRVSRISPAGKLVASANLAMCAAAGAITGRAAGDYVTASGGLYPWSTAPKIARFDADLGKIDYWPLDLPQGVDADGKAQLAYVQGIQEFPGGDLLVQASTSVYAASKKTNFVIARLSATGGAIWVHAFGWPDLSPGGLSFFVAAATTDGGVETIGATKFPEHAASWRFAADGAIRWRRVEDNRRKFARANLSAISYGLFAANPDSANFKTTAFRRTKSDAFGNISCAESGACFDKPNSFCDDKNACTNDLCNATQGCTHTPFLEGTSCKPAMTCKQGVCLK